MIKKNFPTMIIIFLILIILSVFFSIIFYRSFCTLHQDIDWNAVQAISSIFMALLTVTAIYIAIYIPNQDRIAMSKIELYNLRYELFYYLQTELRKKISDNVDGFSDQDEFFRICNNLFFLIQKDDFDEVEKIIHLVSEKITEKNKNIDKLDYSISINEELSNLAKVFSKYLDLRDYGYEPKIIKKVLSK